jgi:hypothetical protein
MLLLNIVYSMNYYLLIINTVIILWILLWVLCGKTNLLNMYTNTVKTYM